MKKNTNINPHERRIVALHSDCSIVRIYNSKLAECILNKYQPNARFTPIFEYRRKYLIWWYFRNLVRNQFAIRIWFGISTEMLNETRVWITHFRMLFELHPIFEYFDKHAYRNRNGIEKYLQIYPNIFQSKISDLIVEPMNTPYCTKDAPCYTI